MYLEQKAKQVSSFIKAFIYTERPSVYIGMNLPYPYIADGTACQQAQRNLSRFLCWIVKQSH